MRILQVAQKDADGRRERRSKSESTQVQTVTVVPSFNEIYELGKEVMPSTHSYMKVHFATRKEDGLETVVKLRMKPNCFRGREDERVWRKSSEFLLNMRECEGICKLHEVLEDEYAFYIVMERVNGDDLFETLELEGTFSIDVVKDVMRQLLHATAHLHSHNAVHKDLKLENVMVGNEAGQQAPPGTSSGSRNRGGQSARTAAGTSIKIIDFDTVEKWTPMSGLAKDVVGTDQYISQEAYNGKYSPLSDVFACGVVAYRLMCGRFPYGEDIFDDEPGDNWVGSPKMKQIRSRLKNAKVDFSHERFRAEPQAVDFIERMMAYNDIQRPTAAAALLHPWLQEDEQTLLASAPSQPRSRGPAGAATPKYAVFREEGLIDDGIIIAEEDR